MGIDAPTKIINMPTGDLYQHPMFSSYTMFSHRETLTKIDKMGYVLSKTTERLTILEALVEDQMRIINELTATKKSEGNPGAKAVGAKSNSGGASTGDNKPQGGSRAATSQPVQPK